MIAIYAHEELGRYGYVEKPWYQPSERLDAFLAMVERRGIAVRHHQAPAATDADLALFHTPEHVAHVTARCATDQGSVDRAPAVVVARVRVLLEGLERVGGGPATDADLQATLAELGGSLAAWGPFLQSDGLVVFDGQAIELTDAGRAFLSDPTASVGGPTYARAHVERAARFVCGAVLDATRRIAAGELGTVFVPISGFHHAFRDQARSYCLYNDPGLAIEAALRAVEGPVAYIDVDIHHGDGVYEGFADHPRVVIADLHERQPERLEHGEIRETELTGRGPGAGNKRAIAMGPGQDDEAYLAAFARLEAFVREHRPAFIVFEAGVDGLASDPMSDQALTPAVFGQVARRVERLADEVAGGRLLVLGGGGYELEGLAAGWGAVLEGLAVS